jgi:hypothetical protein
MSAAAWRTRRPWHPQQQLLLVLGLLLLVLVLAVVPPGHKPPQTQPLRT